MSRIHHTQKQKAEKIGVQLEESGQFVKATWPMRNLSIFGVDARWAIEQMEATQRLIRFAEDRGSELSVRTNVAQPTMVHLIIDGDLTKIANAPIVWWTNRDKIEFADPLKEANESTRGLWENTGRRNVPPQEELNEESEQPENAEGSDTEEPADEEAAKPPASVVKQKYRAIYAEAGHPAHCGDELAEKLKNLVTNGKGTDIEYFKMILTANEIDMKKYKQTGNGWQGRFRMTGRNMLAKRVHANGGVLKMPNGEEFHMSADWMGSQRFQK